MEEEEIKEEMEELDSMINGLKEGALETIERAEEIVDEEEMSEEELESLEEIRNIKEKLKEF